MKERPILMSGPMVQAILGGRKTQTRRVVKPQPTEYGLEFIESDGFSAWQDDGLLLGELSNDGGPCQRICPYGIPGDRLWVKETWAVAPTLNNRKPSELLPDQTFIHYRTNYGNESHFVWRSSIHMPRWASRITLEVAGVRVERVQEITTNDIQAEGIVPDYPVDCIDAAQDLFWKWQDLWDSINAKRGYPWSIDDLPDGWPIDKPFYGNPWVWVVEFKVIE
jgi:hypothetical protein